jgi:hypothetical protein
VLETDDALEVELQLDVELELPEVEDVEPLDAAPVSEPPVLDPELEPVLESAPVPEVPEVVVEVGVPPREELDAVATLWLEPRVETVVADEWAPAPDAPEDEPTHWLWQAVSTRKAQRISTVERRSEAGITGPPGN